MEKQAEINPSENVPQSIDAIFSDDRFDAILHDDRKIKEELDRYGKMQSAANRGVAECLDPQLDSVFEAYKRTTTKKSEVSAREKLETEGRIKELEHKEIETKKKLERNKTRDEGKINEMKMEVQALKNKLKNIREEQLDTPPSNVILEVLIYAVLLGSLVFIFFFYTSTIYRGFFSSLAMGDVFTRESLQKLMQDSGVFRIDSFTSGLKAIFPPLFVFVPLILAVLLHLLWDNVFHINKIWVKWSWISLVIIITMVLDGLIAYKIHEEMTKIKALMGEEKAEFYKDVNFWIILLCGFGVIIILSSVFHGLMVIRKSKNPYYIRKNKEKQYKAELETKESQLVKLMDDLEQLIESLESEMAQFRQQVISLKASLEDDGSMIITYDGKLKLCLMSFYTGWLSTVNHLNGDLEATKLAYDSFIAKRFNERISIPERYEIL